MLKLKDISFGSIDAKNELLNNTESEASRFLASFVAPPALVVEKFFSRDKYYVVGLKGTGKTALLRYISLKLDGEANSSSCFVLFKSEFDEDLRKDFSKASRTSSVEVVSENSEDYSGDDYETVWRWFIYKRIGSLVEGRGSSSFKNDSNLQLFLALVNSESNAQRQKKGFLNIFPKIKRGKVEISKSPKLTLNLSWDSDGNALVNFNDLVRRTDEAFERLEPSSGRLNIFFDELELNYANSKQYQRDSKLIRDLIVSVERLNAVFKKNRYPVCLYAAVRSEVLNAVDSLGKEINKPITDFGTVILWNRPGLGAAQQPLLSIVEQRINNARREVGLPILDSSDVWSQYFPKEIHGKRPEVYILHNSWYRPRDIVRLLISVQDQYPDEDRFNLHGIEAVRKAYSTASWVEFTEELKAKYKPSDIDGIKYIFYGYKQISTFHEVQERSAKVSEDHEQTKSLLSRTSIREILKDLYRIGIIGNIDTRKERVRFSFRGDDEILFDQNIFVHNALRAHFSI